jgi:hypothetical protein
MARVSSNTFSSTAIFKLHRSLHLSGRTNTQTQQRTHYPANNPVLINGPASNRNKRDIVRGYIDHRTVIRHASSSLQLLLQLLCAGPLGMDISVRLWRNRNAMDGAYRSSALRASSPRRSLRPLYCTQVACSCYDVLELYYGQWSIDIDNGLLVLKHVARMQYRRNLLPSSWESLANVRFFLHFRIQEHADALLVAAPLAQSPN